MPLERIQVQRRNGSERFQSRGEALPADLTGYWQWSASDLLSNATRGILAEYIVALGLGLDVSGVRDEWAACDLLTADGVKIEVKSAAYIQSWHQKTYSNISFSIRESREWNPDTNELAAEVKRQADVYVFALLAHRDQATIDPLNLDQWRFYVAETSRINESLGSQATITLSSLEKLCGEGASFSELRERVDQVAGR